MFKVAKNARSDKAHFCRNSSQTWPGCENHFRDDNNKAGEDKRNEIEYGREVRETEKENQGEKRERRTMEIRQQGETRTGLREKRKRQNSLHELENEHTSAKNGTQVKRKEEEEKNRDKYKITTSASRFCTKQDFKLQLVQISDSQVAL